MIDVGKDLQSAFDYGYRQGVKDTLDDIHKTLERSLREQFAHLIKDEPNSSEKPNKCDTCRYNHFGNTRCQTCKHKCPDKYEPKDESQTDLLVKTPRKSRDSHEKNCETCKWWYLDEHCGMTCMIFMNGDLPCHYEPKDEPQTEGSSE